MFDYIWIIIRLTDIIEARSFYTMIKDELSPIVDIQN